MGTASSSRSSHRAHPDGQINLVHTTGRAAWRTVFHFHLHLVPRHERDGLVPPWPLDQPGADAASLRAVADKIRSAGENGLAPPPPAGGPQSSSGP